MQNPWGAKFPRTLVHLKVGKSGYVDKHAPICLRAGRKLRLPIIVVGHLNLPYVWIFHHSQKQIDKAPTSNVTLGFGKKSGI